MTMAPHPKLCPEHGIPDCSPLLNGCSWPMTEDAGCDVARESNTPKKPAWVCSEHGVVYHMDWRANVEVSIAMFCPYCGKEVIRDDALGEIEQRVPAASLDEWAEAQEAAGVPVLRMPKVDL